MEGFMEASLPIAAEELVPHRLPMRLIERLVEIDGKNGTVEARIAADCPLVSGAGKLEDLALIELMAQAYAAVKGYADRLEAKPVKKGFLVGIKKLLRLQSVQVGDLLQIKIRTLAELDGFAVAEGEIWCDDRLLTAGEIKVWVH